MKYHQRVQRRNQCRSVGYIAVDPSYDIIVARHEAFLKLIEVPRSPLDFRDRVATKPCHSKRPCSEHFIRSLSNVAGTLVLLFVFHVPIVPQWMSVSGPPPNLSGS